jgi:ubiquinone/menaquinone biosynthesis C-methylase UbiE
MSTSTAVILATIALGLGWLLWSRRGAACPTWLAWLVELDNPFFKNNSASSIISHLDIKPGMAVLDCGCGPGRLTIPLARVVGPDGEVTAFDLQEGMLERVRAKAAQEGLGNIRTVLGAAGTGRLEPCRFDRAVLINVLGEVPDKSALLRELFDCIKPGGLLCVTEVIADPDFQSRRTVAGLGRQAGFIEEALHGSRLAYSMLFRKP